MDSCNSAVVCGLDRIFHLHGFEDSHFLTSLYRVAYIYLHCDDYTWKRAGNCLACT